MEKITKQDPQSQSADIVAENIEKLKALFPEIITEDDEGNKIDFDTLKEVLGDYIEDKEERYNFTWHGKSRARRLALQGQSWQVSGLSWFDHEWSTSALAPGAVGWDWVGLHLDDGRDLMLAQIRRADGGLEAASAGTLVEPDGTVLALSAQDFQMQPLDYWRSERSGARYPVRWRIQVPELELELTLTAMVEDQENPFNVVYWEGAVRVEGTRRGSPLGGYGYLEMTGYAESMEGSF